MPTSYNPKQNKINWDALKASDRNAFEAFYDWVLSLPEYSGRLAYQDYGSPDSYFAVFSLSETGVLTEQPAWQDDLAMLCRWSREHDNQFGASVVTSFTSVVYALSGLPSDHTETIGIVFGTVENGIPEYRFDIGSFGKMGEARQTAAEYICDIVMD
jgi:hypothetical protein